MHNFIIGFFNFLKSFLHFMKIVLTICIILFLLYWVQNLTSADWEWLGFITPFFAWLIKTTNKIYSFSFNFFGAVFELKYLSALIILTILAYSMNWVILLVNIIEGLYRSTHFICKKTEETIMNKKFKEDITREEKKVNKYMISVHTVIKPKFSHRELNINIDEQNKLMTEFIEKKLSMKPMFFEGGYLYQFDYFNGIDNVLDVFFKVLHSNAPLDYAICVQSGDDMEQLKKLISLKHFGKISMAADTSFRYKFNETHRYGTSQIGLFQYGNKTLEVHEFKELL